MTVKTGRAKRVFGFAGIMRERAAGACIRFRALALKQARISRCPGLARVDC
jgi:hypothetical protein